MRKLKLSLKKEIISDLEANEVKGGAIERYSEHNDCRPRTDEPSLCLMCFPTAEPSCMTCE
jgi:hypothetical protein